MHLTDIDVWDACLLKLLKKKSFNGFSYIDRGHFAISLLLIVLISLHCHVIYYWDTTSCVHWYHIVSFKLQSEHRVYPGNKYIYFSATACNWKKAFISVWFCCFFLFAHFQISISLDNHHQQAPEIRTITYIYINIYRYRYI